MKLKDVLFVINSATRIKIYVGHDRLFSGWMTHVDKAKWDKYVGVYLDCEVTRLDVENETIIIKVMEE